MTPSPSEVLSVAVVGDSLSKAAAEEIQSELVAAGFEMIAFDALTGRRMTWGTDSLPSGQQAITNILASVPVRPDMWVVALGTNDVGAQSSIDTMTAEVTELLSLIGPQSSVVWVDVYIRDRADAAWEFDLAMQEIADGRPNVEIVDWFDIVAAEDGMVLEDGVHLTADGEKRFGAAIVRALMERKE